VKKAVEFPCGNAAGPIDADCLTTLDGGGGRSLDFRAAFVPYYTARCIIRTIAARGIIKLLAKKQTNHPLILMRRYILCVILIFAGIAIPVLQSYWGRIEISSDFHHDANTMCNRIVTHEHREYGIPSYVSVIKDRVGSDTTVHEENLFIYFVIAISFGFLAGRLWPRDSKNNGQQAMPSDGHEPFNSAPSSATTTPADAH
jgi:hypothetical protein